jgi:hypothetical protein
MLAYLRTKEFEPCASIPKIEGGESGEETMGHIRRRVISSSIDTGQVDHGSGG